MSDVGGLAPPWAPSLGDVAEHLRHFTRGRHGAETGTFSADTGIKAAEVDRSIGAIVVEVAAATGPLDVSVHDYAQQVAAIGAAADAVMDRDRELSEFLWGRYRERLDGLRRANDNAGGAVPDSRMPASGRFPAAFDVSRRAF